MSTRNLRTCASLERTRLTVEKDIQMSKELSKKFSHRLNLTSLEAELVLMALRGGPCLDRRTDRNCCTARVGSSSKRKLSWGRREKPSRRLKIWLIPTSQSLIGTPWKWPKAQQKGVSRKGVTMQASRIETQETLSMKGRSRNWLSIQRPTRATDLRSLHRDMHSRQERQSVNKLQSQHQVAALE